MSCLWTRSCFSPILGTVSTGRRTTAMVQQAALVLRQWMLREAESRKAVEQRKCALRGQGKG